MSRVPRRLQIIEELSLRYVQEKMFEKFAKTDDGLQQFFQRIEQKRLLLLNGGPESTPEIEGFIRLVQQCMLAWLYWVPEDRQLEMSQRACQSTPKFSKLRPSVQCIARAEIAIRKAKILCLRHNRQTIRRKFQVAEWKELIDIAEGETRVAVDGWKDVERQTIREKPISSSPA